MDQYILSESDIRGLHKVELELLTEFDRICRKYNIVYSIDGGTLLGAIRHGGFIPWDDDADVIITRPNYEKLLSVVDKELDTDKFYLQDMYRTKGYMWGYAKLRRKGSEFIRLNQEHMPYEQGIFLDIFICDNVPNSYLLRCICNFQSFLFRKMFYARVGVKNSKGLSKIIYYMFCKVSESKLKELYRRYFLMRNNHKSNWVKCLTFPACNRTYGYKREWYEDVVDIEFEGKTLLGSKKNIEYLKFLYGDFMKLPPIGKRKIHPISKFKLPKEMR